MRAIELYPGETATLYFTVEIGADTYYCHVNFEITDNVLDFGIKKLWQ
ncbi:MAG: hypothetical protein LBT76_04175 [Tannerella sp.]|jgi:hypothetical protein|nr:hypothetical protein [Tannerella sp.]